MKFGKHNKPGSPMLSFEISTENVSARTKVAEYQIGKEAGVMYENSREYYPLI